MSPRRGDRAAPPPGPGDWDILFKENAAARGWEELCRQAPTNTLEAWLAMRHDPTPHIGGPRHHRLRGSLAIGTVKGQVLDHWQIEVTGAARVWYLVDHDTKTIWIDHAGPGHPRATA